MGSDRERKAFGRLLQHDEISIYGASQPMSTTVQQFWKFTWVRRILTAHSWRWWSSKSICVGDCVGVFPGATSKPGGSSQLTKVRGWGASNIVINSLASDKQIEFVPTRQRERGWKHRQSGGSHNYFRGIILQSLTVYVSWNFKYILAQTRVNQQQFTQSDWIITQKIIRTNKNLV